MRAFIAVDLGSEIGARLAGLQEKVAPFGNFSFVRKGQFHITLKFLGEVNEGDVKFISEQVKSAAKGMKQFTLSLKGAGYFTRGNFVSVVWVGIDKGYEHLKKLGAGLNEKLKKFGNDDFDFKPHLTIARVKWVKDEEGLVNTIKALEGVNIGEFCVKGLKLKKSVLEPTGPVYSDLETFNLE